MGEARVSVDSLPPARRLQSGTISKIRVENFMCHSNLEIELGEFINFITGQNGSGKSAILTALRIAFGCRAKATERANTLKDFIKIGCSYALVHVELKNQGEDAFKPEIYGDLIILERRITESSSTITLKNCSGKKMANGRDELVKIVEHFNIDVENPCVIMSQDKSREFLNSGSNKDKFRFYFKATLLEQLSELICDIGNRLNQATELVGEMEKSLSPLLREIDEIQAKIRSMEQIEEIAVEVQGLKKKLAWSWVYDVDQQLQRQARTIEKIKGRIPACQDRIDKQKQKMKELRDEMSEKKAKIEDMMVRTSEARRMKAELQQEMRESIKEKFELEGDCDRQRNNIRNLVIRVRSLEQQIQDMQEQDSKDTQAVECEMEQKLREIQNEIDRFNLMYKSLREEEESLFEKISVVENEVKAIAIQIEEDVKMHKDICGRIHRLKQQQTDRVLAFGETWVIRLLQAIKAQQHKFQRPPIGPIGTHVTLVSGDTWATPIENAIGWVLNAFIVTNHQDFLRLKACAKEVGYRNLKIFIHDFSRPRLNVPSHMLPQTDHPTVISMLHSDNPTVTNVLIDTANAERLVLVKDYNTGKAVAFDRRISNLKEVYTSDGYKMFARGSVQTVLPLNKKPRVQRLVSFEKQIKDLERDALQAEGQRQDGQGKKRKLNESLQPLQDQLNSAKRRRQDVERQMRSKELEMQDVKKSAAADVTSAASTSNVDELYHEMSKLQEEIQEREIFLQKVQTTFKEVAEKANNLKISFENLCKSAKEDIDSLEKEEGELMAIEKEYHEAEQEKVHFENVMSAKVVPALKAAEDNYHEVEQKREVNCRKASIICPEAEIKALGDWCGSSPDQLSAKLTRLMERLKRERESCSDSIDDLKQLHEKKRRKIMRKQQMYNVFKENLDACKGALALRQIKFQRNATLAKRELTWKFNSHLGKKGISGKVVLSYEEKTLSIEVTMPQDGSNKSVSDTRGLSGGERSFSTLCFALALHEMTEAPFRAMDEFDVFMDAISRKISLDTLVDFALAHGSQWIFITPHDISIVKQDRRIKKQQMAAPRS